MVFNATFNTISVISLRSVLLVEKNQSTRRNHRSAASHWQTLKIVKKDIRKWWSNIEVKEIQIRLLLWQVIALFYFQHIHLWAKSHKHQHVKTGGFNFRSSWPLNICHGRIFKGRGKIQIFRSGHYAKSLEMWCIKGVGYYAKSLVMWCIKGVGSNHVEVEQKKLYLYIADMAEWSKTLNIRL